MITPTLKFILASSTFFVSTGAFASSSASLLQEGLNVLAEISAAQQQQNQQQAQELSQACNRLRTAIDKLEGFANTYPQLQPLLQQLKKLETPICEQGVESAFTGRVWQEDPFCTKSMGQVPYCQFNHENGRGLFAMAQKNKESFPNFLVCAFTGATGEWLFESDYVISSKCVVSELDWRSPGGRPDVRGVFQWLDEPGTRKPAKLPFALGEQCQTTFSDAAFCSPTLVVMPTQNPDVYDACGLQTHLKGFNPIVVNIVRGQSRWVCETKDLRVVNKQERLSVHEWDCVPNLRGNISSMCKLPYLPTTKSVRYRDLHDDNVPINP